MRHSLAAAALCQTPIDLSFGTKAVASRYREAVSDLSLLNATVESKKAFEKRLIKDEIWEIRIFNDQDRYAVPVSIRNEPMVSSGPFELLHYLREKSISSCVHRYGNMAAQPAELL